MRQSLWCGVSCFPQPAPKPQVVEDGLAAAGRVRRRGAEAELALQLLLELPLAEPPPGCVISPESGVDASPGVLRVIVIVIVMQCDAFLALIEIVSESEVASDEGIAIENAI